MSDEDVLQMFWMMRASVRSIEQLPHVHLGNFGWSWIPFSKGPGNSGSRNGYHKDNRASNCWDMRFELWARSPILQAF